MSVRFLSGVNIDSNTLFVDDANNRVGVGTGSPAYTLDINGVTRFQNIVRFKTEAWNLSDDGQPRFYFGNYLRTYFGSADGYEWRSASDTSLAVITNAGNVGIGTTSPVTTLQVNETSPAIRLQETGSGGDKRLELSVNSSGVATIAANQSAQVLTFETVGSERMRITSSGLVGIGITGAYIDSNDKFIVSGGRLAVNALDYNSASFNRSNAGSILDLLIGGYGKGTIGSDGTNINITAFTDLILSSGSSERMRITSAGNVGIGTTSPGAKLQVGSFDAASELIRLSNSYDTGRSARGGINWHDTTNTTGRIYTEYDGTMVSMVFGSLYNSGYNSNNLMIIRGNGNVGIGTTNPQDKLTVKGATNYNLNLGLLGGYSGIYVYNDASSAYNHLRIDASPLLLNSYSGSNVAIAAGSAITRLTIGAYSGARLPYINGTANTFDANGITVTSSNTANAAIGGGIDLTNNVHSVGSFSPLISFSALSQSGTYNNNYAAIYGILAGDSGDGNWNSGHLVFATALAYGASEKMRITNAGNVGIGTTSPANKLVAVADATFNGENSYAIAAASLTDVAYKTIVGYDYANDVGVISAVRTGIGWKNLSILPVGNTNLGVGTLSPSQRLHVSGNIRVTGAYYDSNNEAGTSGQVLTSTGSGTAWVNQGEAVASSLFDLLPNARVTYDWTVQLTAGTWADIFSSNTVLSNGTWMVQAFVNDYAVGGQQYSETYSGVMSWGSAGGTNNDGVDAESEIILHRSGHAAQAGNFYLRTVERAASTLLFQGMSNQTYSAASTINFKFVKIF